MKGSVIVIGDTNVHLSHDVGVRGWGRTTTNGHTFIRTMSRCEMQIIDMGDKGTCPVHTYEASQCTSYIDHVCVSSALYSHVRYCKVFDDDVSNVSDHMPISVDLIIPALNDNYNQCNTGSIQWHRLSADDIKYCYTLPL